MAEVQFDQIPEQWRISVNEYARAAAVSRKETYRRMAPGDEHEITWARSARGRVIDALKSKGLSFEAIKEWQRGKQVANLAAPQSDASPVPPAQAATGQGVLIPQTEGERALSDLKSRICKLNPTKFEGIKERFLLIEPLTNHKFALDAQTRWGYAKKIAPRVGPHGVKPNTLWRWYKDFERALNEKGMEAALESLGKNEPGPEPGYRSPLDDSMKCIVTRLWLEGKTRRQCYEGMRAELGEKCRVLAATWVYDAPKKPLYYAVTRYINAPLPRGLGGESNPARRGHEAVFNAAGYMDRHYEDEQAGETWCIDEWELDGMFYLLKRRREIVTPYLVSVIDERTTKIFGWRLSPSLDAETVLDLMEELVRKLGAPRFLASDRLGHYRRMLQHKMALTRKSELMDRLAGPLELLGVTNRGPKRAKNPRGNRIERVHGIYSDLARRDFGPSWREPLEGKHKLRRVDENIKRHLRDHCKLGISGPQLLSYKEAERIAAGWVSEVNAADTEANGCHGLTRQAAYLQFQPEQQRERPKPAVIDLAFAQKIERTVRGGGVIEIDGEARYSSPQLLGRTGEKVMVIRYRRDKSRIFVSFDESREAIEAALRVPVGTKETARRLGEASKLMEARALLARQEVPLAAFEDTPEEEARQVRDMLPRTLAERHPSVEQLAPPHEQPPEWKPLSYFGGE